ncbi:Nucleoplasmin-2, partial [Galemys pyrenaicus]
MGCLILGNIPQRRKGKPLLGLPFPARPSPSLLSPVAGCELSQEKPTWTFKPQKEQDCKLLLTTICLGEKAKEDVNLVEILPPVCEEERKTKPIVIASLRASVLPMVVTTGLEFCPLVTFQLRAGSGPVFLSGLESYGKSKSGAGK